MNEKPQKKTNITIT